MFSLLDDEFRLGSELNEIDLFGDVYPMNDLSKTSTCTSSSYDTWENCPEFAILNNLDDDMSVLTENTHQFYDARMFDLSCLDKERFYKKLLCDITNDNERKELVNFETKLKVSNFGPRTLDKVTKRFFGKDYLKGSGMTPAQIRDHINLLEMKFYAIACRHLIIQKNNGFTMTKDAFLKKFKPAFDFFFDSKNDHYCKHAQRNYYEQLMNDDSELELLFRFLAPILILDEYGCDGNFFRRRSGLLLALGEFMEFSDRQYTSGGGKTLATKLREACMDQITGNERSTRNRKSKSQPSNLRKQRKQARRMLFDSDTDSESDMEYL